LVSRTEGTTKKLNESPPLEETYGYNLQWSTWQKRLWFGGAANATLEFRMDRRVEDLKETADAWPDLMEAAIQVFRKHGFVRIEP